MMWKHLLHSLSGAASALLEWNLFYLGDIASTPTGLDISQNGSGALEEGTTPFICTTPRTRSQIISNESVNKGMGCVG